jgi:hypothetical protein
LSGKKAEVRYRSAVLVDEFDAGPAEHRVNRDQKRFVAQVLPGLNVADRVSMDARWPERMA